MLLTTPPDAPRTAPLVSVIVPMLDAQDRVRYCVDSVLRQSFPYLEVLLADAGSTDDTPAILDEYARRDDRVSLVRLPVQHATPAQAATPSGNTPSAPSSPSAPFSPSDTPDTPDAPRAMPPATAPTHSPTPRHTPATLINAARNVALDRATGEFVLFVDSAEILDRRAVELLLHALVRSDADMAKARWDSFDASDLYAVAELAAAGAREPESVTVTAEPLHAYGSVWRRCVRAAGDALHRDVEGRLFGESLSCRLYRTALWDGLRFPVDSTPDAAATASDAVRDSSFAADAALDHTAPDYAKSDRTALRTSLYARMRRMAGIDVPLVYRRSA